MATIWVINLLIVFNYIYIYIYNHHLYIMIDLQVRSLMMLRTRPLINQCLLEMNGASRMLTEIVMVLRHVRSSPPSFTLKSLITWKMLWCRYICNSISLSINQSAIQDLWMCVAWQPPMTSPIGLWRAVYKSCKPGVRLTRLIVFKIMEMFSDGPPDHNLGW